MFSLLSRGTATLFKPAADYATRATWMVVCYAVNFAAVSLAAVSLAAVSLAANLFSHNQNLPMVAQTVRRHIHRSVRPSQNTAHSTNRRRTHIHRWCSRGRFVVASRRFRSGGRLANVCRSYAQADTSFDPRRRHSPGHAKGTSGYSRNPFVFWGYRLARQSSDNIWPSNVHRGFRLRELGYVAALSWKRG